MEHKGLYVSQKDIRRYELLQKVLDEGLKLAVAAPAPGVSYRQALRLKARVKAQGLRGLLPSSSRHRGHTASARWQGPSPLPPREDNAPMVGLDIAKPTAKRGSGEHVVPVVRPDLDARPGDAGGNGVPEPLLLGVVFARHPR